mgnify:FL=1
MVFYYHMHTREELVPAYQAVNYHRFIPTLLGIIAAYFLLPISAIADEIIFFDDFKGGSADNWELIDIGYYSVNDETLCLETLCAP